MTIIIRPANIDELPFLSRLCLRSKAVWGYDQTFLDACRSELTLRPDDLSSSRVAVAETLGAVAGVVQVKVVATDADLLKLFIDPDRLRCGAGSALFRWAIEQARALGATRMIIEADPDAAAFYRRLGGLRHWVRTFRIDPRPISTETGPRSERTPLLNIGRY